jgi:hypothetical protein
MARAKKNIEATAAVETAIEVNDMAAEVTNEAVETAVAETATDAKVAYRWANWVTEKCLRLRKSSSGKDFYSVSLPYPKADANAKGQRFCSLAVNPSQVKDSTIHATGEVKPGFKNILLGKAGSTKTISYIKNGQVEKEKITVDEIVELYEADRKEFRAAAVAETV